jgi:hypothetical protein
MPALLSAEPAIGRVVAEIVRALHFDPWLGQEMRERLRLEILEDLPEGAVRPAVVQGQAAVPPRVSQRPRRRIDRRGQRARDRPALGPRPLPARCDAARRAADDPRR